LLHREGDQALRLAVVCFDIGNGKIGNGGGFKPFLEKTVQILMGNLFKTGPDFVPGNLPAPVLLIEVPQSCRKE